MSFTYQQLAADEIRLLSFDDAKEASHHFASAPIVCTLEHVRLPSATSPDVSSGESCHSWPELSEPHDTAALFKTGRDPCAGTTKPQACVDTAASPSWRYGWGDFIALSYAWGPVTPQRSIVLNGAPFWITPNLHDALAELRRSQTIRRGFKVWVDAICINQDDLVERAQQVGCMRNIYQSAWQVVIWVGKEAEDSSLALAALHWLAGQATRSEPLEGFYNEGRTIDARPFFIKWATYESPMKKRVYEALFYFFARPYWRRMWVIQEVAMGRTDSPVLCGNRCIPWNDIYQAVTVIGSDEARFGREVLESTQPRIVKSWSFEFARDRLAQETPWTSERMWMIQATMMEIQRSQRSTRPPDTWRDLARALILSRHSKVTEERDRVYGLLGIRAVAARVQVVPNYTVSLPDLYSNFTLELMSTGNLNVLRLVSRHAGATHTRWDIEDLPSRLKRRSIAPLLLILLHSMPNFRKETQVGTPCSHGLPSWAVCWTCKPAPTAELRGNYQADASLGAPAPITPPINLILSVKGVILDKVTSLSAFHVAEVDIRYPLNNSASYPSIYGDLEATQNALWRTIVADTTRQGGSPAPESYSWLLEPRLWQEGVAGIYTNGFGLHIFMSRNKSLNICGYTLEELIFGIGKSSSRWEKLRTEPYYNATEAQRQALSWAMNSLAWRRLIGTKDGRMGLGVAAVETGDRIAILKGCNTPMVVRKSGKDWSLIGECYLHGVMRGEHVVNECDVTDIRLH